MDSYEKRYKEALEVAKRKLCFDKAGMVDSFTPNDIYEIFPELKESEDEKIRKELIGFLRNIPNSNYTCEEMALWLEKQGENHDDKYNITGIKSKHAEGKLGEMIKEIKSTDKVEPKFKVKYAGSEYNVFETKNIAGVTYYGIEDEPNHIDYVQAENCERVGGYSIKEKGSPYPTKPAKFSEQKSTWSEEDEVIIDEIIYFLENGTVKLQHDLSLYASWLKSLRDRYLKNTWKPSDEQMEALLSEVNAWTKGCPKQKILKSLYQDLKKLK